MWRPGDVVSMEFDVRDLNGTLKSGLLNFSVELYRRTGAGAYAATSETVSTPEYSPGTYSSTFTLGPAAAGYTYFLRVTDEDYPGSAFEVHTGSWTVEPAVTTDYESYSFCAIEDVEARCGRGAFGTGTIPTASVVTGFMRERSARIEARLVTAGYAWTVPSGTHPFAAVPTADEERRLALICRNTAASGAAADAIAAWLASDSFDVPERAKQLLLEYEAGLDSIKDADRGTMAIVTTGTANANVRTTVEW